MSKRIPWLALAALAAAAAHAQPTPSRPPLGVEQGFFRPAPDPALTPVRPVTPPPAAPAAQTPVQAAGTPPMQAAGPFPPQPEPIDPAEAIRLAEEQLDRSEREAERARLATQAAPPIAGAFTGLTSERDR